MTPPPADATRRGFSAVLLSIVIAGVAGYTVQLLAPAMTDAETYVSFAVFWSTLYLGGTALSGIQQEVARATRPRDDAGGDGHAAVLRALVMIAGAVTLVAVVAVTPLVSPAFDGSPAVLGIALTIGLAGYLLMAVFAGVLFGLHEWRAVAALAITDALLRVVVVVAVLALGLPVEVIVLAVAAPFGVAAFAIWAVVRRRIAHRWMLDVRLRTLLAHTSGTVVAAAGSGVLIAGMPLLIGATARDEPAAVTAGVLLAVTITRAPIVVPIMALQSLLISTVFRSGGRGPGSRSVVLVAVVVVVVLGACVAAWALGDPVVAWLSGGRYGVDSSAAVAIVGSAFLVGAMCVTSPALIAGRRHAVNAGGWVLAAVATLLILLALPDAAWRIPLALTVPPVLGLIVHSLGLSRAAARRAAAANT